MNAHVKSPEGVLPPKLPDGLGMLPRIGEPESALIPGMAAPRPLARPPAALLAPSLLSMPDTSIGPVALQQPLWWNYDFDPVTKQARATFLGVNQPGTLGAISAGAIAAQSLTLSTPLGTASGGTNDSGTSWTAYSPTCTANGGTIGSYTATGRYKLLGKTCFWQANVTITAIGTATSGLRITCPPGVQGGGDTMYMLAFDIVSGASYYAGRTTGTALVIVQTPGSAFPGTTNSEIIVSGIFETQ